MSIVYDYEGIGPLVKGDTWWTAEKPADLFGKGPAMMAVESFNQALREVERLFVEAMQDDRVIYSTSLPSAVWQQLNAAKPNP